MQFSFFWEVGLGVWYDAVIILFYERSGRVFGTNWPLLPAIGVQGFYLYLAAVQGF